EPPAASPGPPRAGSDEPTYLVVYRPGPRWPGGDTTPPELRDHFRYLIGLHQAGALQLAAPSRARPAAPRSSLLQADPAVVARVFDVDLRRWSPVDGATHAERAAP